MLDQLWLSLQVIAKAAGPEVEYTYVQENTCHSHSSPLQTLNDQIPIIETALFGTDRSITGFLDHVCQILSLLDSRKVLFQDVLFQEGEACTSRRLSRSKRRLQEGPLRADYARTSERPLSEAVRPATGGASRPGPHRCAAGLGQAALAGDCGPTHSGHRVFGWS